MSQGIPTDPAENDGATLQVAEAAISSAIDRRDASDLKVLRTSRGTVLPFVARSSMAERWWSTKVRRRPYDFFITDSFSGELL